MASPLERGRALLRELEADGGPPSRTITPEEEHCLAAVLVEEIKACVGDPDAMPRLLSVIGAVVNKTRAATRVRDLIQQFVERYEREPVREYWDGVKRELFPA